MQLRDRLHQTQADAAAPELRIAEIGQEQSRIRDNLGRLASNSELANRYIRKLDQQETELGCAAHADRKAQGHRGGEITRELSTSSSAWKSTDEPQSFHLMESSQVRLSVP